MPVIDSLCTNNHTDPSDNSKPFIEHKDERSKVPEPPNTSLTRIPTGNSIGTYL